MYVCFSKEVGAQCVVVVAPLILLVSNYTRTAVMRRFIRSYHSYQRRSVIDKVWCFTDSDSQSLTDSLLLMDFPDVVRDVQDIHKNNYLDVSSPVPAVMPVLAVRDGTRLATTVAVTIPSVRKTKYIPVIVDTGAPRALYLSKLTWELFGIPAVPRLDRKNPLFSCDARVGKWAGEALLSEEHGASDEHLAGANVLGMGLLGARDVAKSFTKLLKEATELDFVPISEFIVTGQGSTFGVKPEHPVVWSLKQAIKGYMMYSIAPPFIIIKSLDGKVMGEEDPLLAGVKYRFELPATK